MSQLTLYSQFNMRKPYLVSTDIEDFAEHLESDNIRFEQWPIRHDSALCQNDQESTLALYSKEVALIKAQLNLPNCELLCACDDKGTAISLRARSLSEHVHADAEVRFFLNGRALIYVHANERIHIVECNAGDFIVVPPNIPHWFDMGPNPNYACLRWFDTREGLRKEFTGSYMAESIPRWEALLGE